MKELHMSCDKTWYEAAEYWLTHGLDVMPSSNCARWLRDAIADRKNLLTHIGLLLENTKELERLNKRHYDAKKKTQDELGWAKEEIRRLREHIADAEHNSLEKVD